MLLLGNDCSKILRVISALFYSCRDDEVDPLNDQPPDIGQGNVAALYGIVESDDSDTF